MSNLSLTDDGFSLDFLDIFLIFGLVSVWYANDSSYTANCNFSLVSSSESNFQSNILSDKTKSSGCYKSLN